MNFTLVMIFVNTLFWIALHFGVAALVTTAPPLSFRRRWFDNSKRFFQVSRREMDFYRWIRLPKWKDRLPQYNDDFEKRHLSKEMTPSYVREFLFMTCQAEVVHYSIAVAGYLSMLFCLLCNDPVANLPLFFGIATFIGLCNMPFALIQRYNRYRLARVMAQMECRIAPGGESCPVDDTGAEA